MKMKEYMDLIEASKKKIKIANHMLGVTYPLVKDGKILLTVLENVFISFEMSIKSLISLEQSYKKVPILKEGFDSLFDVFKRFIVPKYNIHKKYVELVMSVKNAVSYHKKSPIEFSRQGEFVICDNNYNMKKLSMSDLKHIVSESKVFVNKISDLVDNYRP